MSINQQALTKTDLSLPTLYCYCQAAPIQLEIDCLKESIQDALDQASEESDDLEKRRQVQQREIDILKAKIKESNERGDILQRQHEDTMKGLEETKTRIISRSRTSSFSSFLSSLASTDQSSSSSRNRRRHSSFSLRRPSLTREVRRFSCPPSILENRQSPAFNDLTLASNSIRKDVETKLSDISTLKLRLLARDKEIASLKDALDDNLKIMQHVLLATRNR